MQTDIDPRSLIGRKAIDSGGGKLGTVGEVYLDDATGEPDWAALRTGLFAGLFGRGAFIPLGPARLVGEVLRVPFTRALVRGAPDLGIGRHLSPRQELLLYRYYGLDVPSPAESSGPGHPPPDRDFGRIAGSGSGSGG